MVRVTWQRLMPRIYFSRPSSSGSYDNRRDYEAHRTLIDIRVKGTWALLERHSRECCTCSYCRRDSRHVFGYRVPKDITGWRSFHIFTKKSVYYLRYTLNKDLERVKKFERELLKKYIPEDIRKLHDFLSREITDYKQSVFDYSSFGISYPMASNMRRILKKKTEDMPLFISSPSKYVRAFAKWRIHCGL